MQRIKQLWVVGSLLGALFVCGASMVPSRADAAEGEAITEETAPLKLGIPPFFSAPTLLRVHSPLREHLEMALNRKVVIYSAVNHEQFLLSMLKGRFDIAVTPVHFVSLAAEQGFVPLLRYRHPFKVLLVVRGHSDIRGIKDLLGRSIGLPDSFSFYHLIGMQWLCSLSSKPNLDFLLSEQPSHMAGMMSVEAGRIDAVVTALPLWRMLGEGIRKKLRTIDVSHQEFPSLVTMVHSSLGEAQIERIRAALEAFPQTEEGKLFFETSDYGGYVPVTKKDLVDAHRYGKMVTWMLDLSAQNKDIGQRIQKICSPNQ
ncbi:MAG: phosphate/phosphite/phosphonate ABC transporter substrate-binding protein [Azoarcus sp.]|jgi:phosphonate transport system substrate-binding protein|nr:phosphate/phosphite/phosphonate ABC transporter substrate-binding protein [Azoarcus sp.]